MKCLRNVFEGDVKEAVRLLITGEGGLDPYGDGITSVTQKGLNGRAPSH